MMAVPYVVRIYYKHFNFESGITLKRAQVYVAKSGVRVCFLTFCSGTVLSSCESGQMLGHASFLDLMVGWGKDDVGEINDLSLGMNSCAEPVVSYIFTLAISINSHSELVA